MSGVEKELAKVGKKCKLAEATEANAKSRVEVEEIEVAHLKDKLKEIETALASKKKERFEVQAKAIDVERKAQEPVAEMGHIAVEAFHASTEYLDEKCAFS